MTWQKAIFYGGSMLLLAACSNATTAPTPPTQLQKVNGTGNLLGDSTSVQSGYYVRGGGGIASGLIFRAP